MINDRILDTGVSVRKRVIKILKDICIEHPEFEKIPEICARMIRRVDDELGIKVGKIFILFFIFYFLFMVVFIITFFFFFLIWRNINKTS